MSYWYECVSRMCNCDFGIFMSLTFLTIFLFNSILFDCFCILSLTVNSIEFSRSKNFTKLVVTVLCAEFRLCLYMLSPNPTECLKYNTVLWRIQPQPSSLYNECTPATSHVYSCTLVHITTLYPAVVGI